MKLLLQACSLFSGVAHELKNVHMLEQLHHLLAHRAKTKALYRFNVSDTIILVQVVNSEVHNAKCTTVRTKTLTYTQLPWHLICVKKRALPACNLQMCMCIL